MSEFEIRQTGNRGKGLFALRNFDKNQIILRIDGDHIKYSEAIDQKIPEEIFSRFLQVGPELYINFEKHHSVFANHSCNPNCYAKVVLDRAFLVATIPIKKGDELIYDYSLTSTENKDQWNFECSCGDYNCRKVISGFGQLSDTDKKKYLDMGIVPDYVKKVFNI